jgi:hypothetical protein
LRLEDPSSTIPRMSEYSKTIIGIAIVLGSAFVGFLIAGPVRDAGARQICSEYAADEGFVLIDAQGGPRSVPAYSCRFTDRTGSTVLVDEDDHLIDLTYRHRGYGIAGFVAWAVVILLSVRLCGALGLFERPSLLERPDD